MSNGSVPKVALVAPLGESPVETMSGEKGEGRFCQTKLHVTLLLGIVEHGWLGGLESPAKNLCGRRPHTFPVQRCSANAIALHCLLFQIALGTHMRHARSGPINPKCKGVWQPLPRQATSYFCPLEARSPNCEADVPRLPLQAWPKPHGAPDKDCLQSLATWFRGLRL